MAKGLAPSLPASAWRDVAFPGLGHAGTKEDLVSRFAAQPIRPAHRDDEREEHRPELWLLIERPEDEDEPINFWFANLPADTSIDHLVRQASLRWRIERDYLERKQAICESVVAGLGHYEGRGRHGFHHHASPCIAAFGFLVAERLTFPPKAATPSQASDFLYDQKPSNPAAAPISPERHPALAYCRGLPAPRH